MSTNRICKSRWLGLLALLAGLSGPALAEESAEDATRFVAEAGSAEPLILAAWAFSSGDSLGKPFVIVDKQAARVFAFDAAGNLVSDTAALLGVGRGDVSPPGIGTLRLADITPEKRITPAGRFEAHLGKNLAGHQILWVDYDEALSLHAVVTGKASERRLDRLATESILDNRISYGCINVPARFFHDIVGPLFAPANGIVYILPEAPGPVSKLTVPGLVQD